MPDIESIEHKGPESGCLADDSKFYKQCTKDEYSTALPTAQSTAVNDYMNKRSESIVSYESYKQGVSQEISEESVTSKVLSKFNASQNSTKTVALGVWEHDRISPACQPY